MSDQSHDNGSDGARPPGEVVHTMPLAIAEIRERLERLNAKLDGVDTNLVRIVGSDPNATEELRLTPGMRAQIDRAAAAIDDTDTQIPVVQSHKDTLAEIDAVLDAEGRAPSTPAGAAPKSGWDRSGLKETLPEFPASPAAPPVTSGLNLEKPQSRPAAPAPQKAGTESRASGGGGMTWIAAAIVLVGGGYFAWQATTTGPASTTAQVAPVQVQTTTPAASAPKAKAPAPKAKAPAPKAKVVAPKPVAPARKAKAPAPKAVTAAPAPKVAAPAPKAVAPAPKAQVPVPAQPKPAPAPPERVAAAAVDKPVVAPTPSRPKSRISEGDLVDALQAIRADPAPDAIIRGTHYVISNEARHDLWRERVSNLGGIMVGVGAEQNYILAGWSRPEVLVLMDFDIYITRLHKAYRVAFEAAATPDELIGLWQEEGTPRLNDLIIEAYGETGAVQDILRSVKSARAVGRHLAKVKASYAERQIPCFLTDQSQYDFIVELWRTDRVLPIRGDLRGDRTLVDVAAFSRISGLPVRLLYTSNAEYYFRFKAGRFRDNIVGLPFDEGSKVFRTDPYAGTKYRYYEQRSEDFVAWLERGTASNVAWMAKHRTQREDPDDYVLDKRPEQVGKAK